MQGNYYVNEYTPAHLADWKNIQLNKRLVDVVAAKDTLKFHMVPHHDSYH